MWAQSLITNIALDIQSFHTIGAHLYFESSSPECHSNSRPPNWPRSVHFPSNVQLLKSWVGRMVELTTQTPVSGRPQVCSWLLRTPAVAMERVMWHQADASSSQQPQGEMVSGKQGKFITLYMQNSHQILGGSLNSFFAFVFYSCSCSVHIWSITEVKWFWSLCLSQKVNHSQ